MSLGWPALLKTRTALIMAACFKIVYFLATLYLEEFHFLKLAYVSKMEYIQVQVSEINQGYV